MIKKLTSLALAAVMALALVGCGSKKGEPSATPAAPVVLADFYAETYDELYPVDSEGNPTGPFTEDFAQAPEMLEGFYPGLSDIETKQLHVYMPAMSGVPYEVALVEVADAADIEAVKTILQTRIDTESANQMNYPAVIENWELNSRIVVNGNYVMMAVCENCEDFVNAFNNMGSEAPAAE